jgi:hypothetical protein
VTAPRKIIMYVQPKALTQMGLTADQMIESAAIALQELGIAEALVMVHGPDRGLRRYFEAGGHMRFTSWGDPYVPVLAPKRGRRARV